MKGRGGEEFVEHLHESFERLGPVVIKRMFGGQGIWYQGLMIGLVADEVLYLKTDPESVAAFTSRGLGPFEFMRAGRAMRTSYFQAPAECLEDRDEAGRWARDAWAAALRAAGKTAGKTPGAREAKLARGSAGRSAAGRARRKAS